MVRASFRPNVVVAAGPAGATEPPLLDARTEIGGEPAAYVCEGFTCNLPVTDPEAPARVERGCQGRKERALLRTRATEDTGSAAQNSRTSSRTTRPPTSARPSPR